jgi:hypothetical protein
MKEVNDWSVVKTTLGISLKPIDGYGEVCISVVDGFIRVAVYPEILNDPDLRFADHALSELRVPMALLNNEGGI